MCKQILQNLCNSSAMKYSADYVWVLAHQTWAAKYFMGRAPSDEIKDPAASNGVSNLQRYRAAGYLTLAAVAKCLQAATWLVARGNKR